ncbi:hypothetical protein DUHN55_45990 [Helicobacter pylori]
MLHERAAGGGHEHRGKNENDGEAEDKQQRTQDHPATAAPLQCYVGQASDVAEIARYEGQHAGRGEGNEPREGRDERRERQSPTGDLVT